MRGAYYMNGIKYIREKSNFSKNALAERMDVTRQTISLWEKGIRKPSKKHLLWLCTFYGIDEKWFGELSDDEIECLNNMRMYRHYYGDKEYFSFVPDKSNNKYLHFSCGEIEKMLDDKYMQIESDKRVCLYDKINTAWRGISDIGLFLDLLDTIHTMGLEGTFLKVSYRYEIKTILYAALVASGQYTIDEIKMDNNEFEDEIDGCKVAHVDEEYMKNLIEMMQSHWNDVKSAEIEKVERIKGMYK